MRVNLYACICGVWFLTMRQLDDHWLHEHIQKGLEAEFEDVILNYSAREPRFLSRDVDSSDHHQEHGEDQNRDQHPDPSIPVRHHNPLNESGPSDSPASPERL